MTHYDITSPANERIKRLVRLRQRKHRDDERVFLVEGIRLFRRAVEAGLEPVEVYWDGSTEADPGVRDTVLVEPSVLDKASYRQSSQGLIGVFAQFKPNLEEVTPSSPALVIVTESIEKPGNLGAMIRTASAVGADLLITLRGTVDIFNPNAIRSSTGALFSLPIITADPPALRSWLDAHRISLFATSPETSLTIWDVDFTTPCALMIGAEDTGLTQTAIDVADEVVSIPMSSAGLDSLNASVSLAVVAYEAVRQRRRHGDL